MVIPGAGGAVRDRKMCQDDQADEEDADVVDEKEADRVYGGNGHRLAWYRSSL